MKRFSRVFHDEAYSGRFKEMETQRLAKSLSKSGLFIVITQTRWLFCREASAVNSLWPDIVSKVNRAAISPLEIRLLPEVSLSNITTRFCDAPDERSRVINFWAFSLVEA